MYVTFHIFMQRCPFNAVHQGGEPWLHEFGSCLLQNEIPRNSRKKNASVGIGMH